MLTVQYGLSLEDEGFTVLALSPGWVKTDLGGANADLDIDISITAILNIIFNSSEKDNAKFLDISVPGFNQYTGGEIPW
ncbi:hypothetical protein CEP54_010126 [Fusarium duplospermum]|uniref:Uncharacterized protein n=1 Tax=Fusarium duplospermum TaxID=1325734 RepID=A0A428PLU5_9HYPO|nr:hypothetical protein CEP54_010126 [Fusarium duplospermum]